MFDSKYIEDPPLPSLFYEATLYFLSVLSLYTKQTKKSYSSPFPSWFHTHTTVYAKIPRQSVCFVRWTSIEKSTRRIRDTRATRHPANKATAALFHDDVISDSIDRNL